VEWINLAQDRYKKKAVLSAGNLLLAEKRLDSENDFCSVELFIYLVSWLFSFLVPFNI
jgi:hypothetical protein